MSRKFWENRLIDRFDGNDIRFTNFMHIYKQISKNRPYTIETENKQENKSDFLLLLSGLTNKELKDFYNKIDYDIREINNKYSIRNYDDNSPIVFNDNGFLAQIKYVKEDGKNLFYSIDEKNNPIENTRKIASSTLNFEDSLKEYIESTLINKVDKSLDFNHDKYFLNLYSKYTELTNNGVACDIYFSSEVGHIFVSREELLKDFNKDNATAFMLADGKGQCIFNKEIFENDMQSKNNNILSYDDFKNKLTQKHSEDSLKEKYGEYLNNKLKNINNEQVLSINNENDNLIQINN